MQQVPGYVSAGVARAGVALATLGPLLSQDLARKRAIIELFTWFIARGSAGTGSRTESTGRWVPPRSKSPTGIDEVLEVYKSTKSRTSRGQH